MLNRLYLHKPLFNNFLKRSIVTKFDTLVDLQEKSCNVHSNNPLFGIKNNNTFNWVNYDQWDKYINSFRYQLSTLNNIKDDKIAIISNNKIEWSVAAYATYSLGCIFVPMYETQSKKDWKYILNDSKSKTLICTNLKTYERCKSLNNEISTLENVIYFDINDLPENNFNKIYPEKSDLATLIYTSGTTGNPKGVQLTHDNISENIKSIQNSFTDFSKVSNENDTSLSFLPWAHCYGQTCELHSALSAGGRIAISEGVEHLVDELSIAKPTLLFSVPALFNKIYDGINKNMSESILKKLIFNRSLKVSQKIRENNGNFINNLEYNIYNKVIFSKIKEKLGGNLKFAFVGGAATPFEVLNFFENINVPIIEGYGLTETTPIVTLNSDEYPTRKLGSVGRPLPNNKVHIFNKNEDGIGEICATGPNIMKGYNLDSDNENVFLYLEGEKYFRTGDMGYLDDDNNLYIKGRLKEQYKLENGKFVTPGKLEESIILSPFIKQVLIYGENREYNIALIVPESDKMIDDHFYLEEINKILKKKKCKKYEIPKQVLILDKELTIADGFLTPKMSIKRQKVIDHYIENINELYDK